MLKGLRTMMKVAQSKQNWRFFPAARLLSMLVAVCALVVFETTSVGAESPTEVVRNMTTAVIAVLQNKGANGEAKRTKIRGIAEGYMAFPTMSRLVLARNWQGLSDEQKQEFTEQFKQHLSVTYGRNVESYNNEKVQISGDRDEGRGDWTVQTKILRPQGGGDILVDYRLRQVNGEWKVIDLVIERVSLVSNFRSQFQDVMAQGGIDRLLKVLREKNSAGEPLKS